MHVAVQVPYIHVLQDIRGKHAATSKPTWIGAATPTGKNRIQKKKICFFSRQQRCVQFRSETIANVEAAWTQVAKTTWSIKIDETSQMIAFSTCVLLVGVACMSWTCHYQLKSNRVAVFKIFYTLHMHMFWNICMFLITIPFETGLVDNHTDRALTLHAHRQLILLVAIFSCFDLIG